jgi:hypothetical protein
MGSNDAIVQNNVAACLLAAYNLLYIRPLAVSPLTYPESVPTPWGFPISGLPIGVVV